MALLLNFRGGGHPKNKLLNGFTMAEVLITLGIIGIVVSMTMPIFIANYRKKVIEARLAAFYSKINQAVQMAEADFGPKEYWDLTPSAGYVTDENGRPDYSKPKVLAWFNQYMRPYIKVIKIVPEGGFIVVYLIDGSCMRIAGQSIQFYPFAKDYKGFKDTSISGIRFFTFYLSTAVNTDDSAQIQRAKYHMGKAVEPYVFEWDGREESLVTNTYYGCYESNPRERAYCTMIIMRNGWKIPDDYPLKIR